MSSKRIIRLLSSNLFTDMLAQYKGFECLSKNSSLISMPQFFATPASNKILKKIIKNVLCNKILPCVLWSSYLAAACWPGCCVKHIMLMSLCNRFGSRKSYCTIFLDKILDVQTCESKDKVSLPLENSVSLELFFLWSTYPVCFRSILLHHSHHDYLQNFPQKINSFLCNTLRHNFSKVTISWIH